MPLTLPALADGLNAALPAGSYVAMLLEDYSESVGIDSTHVAIGSAEIEVPGNTLVVGSAVVFSTSGTLYAPFLPNKAYRVVAKGTGFKVELAATAGGTPISVSSLGLGNHTISSLQPVEMIGTEAVTAFAMADLVRYEITNYPAAGRPSATLSGTAPKNTSAQFVESSLSIDNSDGTTTIEFDYVALVMSGLTTPGHTGGVCKAVAKATPSPAQVPAGEQRVVPVELLLGPC